MKISKRSAHGVPLPGGILFRKINIVQNDLSMRIETKLAAPFSIPETGSSRISVGEISPVTHLNPLFF